MTNTRFSLPILAILLLQVLLPTIIATGPRCWRSEVSPRPLVFKECNDVINHKVEQTYDSSRRPFNPSLPLIFSRDRALDPDVKTPKTWSDGDCLVGVDIPSHQGGSDKTSLNDIRMAAMAIAVHCVIKPPHLGGILQVGWATKINVVLTSLGERRSVMAGKTRFNGTLEEA